MMSMTAIRLLKMVEPQCDEQAAVRFQSEVRQYRRHLQIEPQTLFESELHFRFAMQLHA